MKTFRGFDHVDCRVPSLPAVEAFYDALMPELGLPNKRYARVDAQGEWHAAGETEPYNTVEYYEPPQNERAAFFIGFIEDANHRPGFTRIAFRVSRARMFELEKILGDIGARNIERSEDLDAYPAIFFEDPGGLKLEIVSRDPVD